MAEPTPGPTPNRAVYGFAWFLFSKTLFILFLFWVFVPEYIQHNLLGLTYLPDKYFAMVLPVLILTVLTFFAFLIYPPMNLAMQDSITNVHTIRDSRTVRRCQYVSIVTGKRCEEKVHPIPASEANNFNIWTYEQLCTGHQNINKERTDADDDSLNGFCDCTNKTRCLLGKKPNHLKLLRNRAIVPSISDLDLVEVSKQLFLDD